MKLIDILVNELPKRGGWNINAHGAVQDNSGQVWFYKNGNPEFSGVIWGADNNSDGFDWVQWDLSFEKAEDAKKAIVTHEQYEAAIAAQQQAWNGEGLPPVGTECEVIEGKPLSVFDKWTPCKVISFNCRDEKETQVCIIDDNGDFAILYSNDAFKFRPIRIEEERKREDSETALRTCLAGTGAGITPLAAKGIYDAIAAGKIPGLRLSDD